MKNKRFLAFLVWALLLAGCSNRQMDPSQAVMPRQSQSAVSTAHTKQIDALAEGMALAQAPPPALPVVLTPQSPGIDTAQGNGGLIDYSCRADGYITVLFSQPSESRLKVLVKGPCTTYSYNLTPQQETAFPLSDGSGSYQVGIYQNVTGNKYATLLSASFETQLADEFAPFLRPNQYVDYTAATEAVKLSMELTEDITDPLEQVAAVYDYVITTLSYDHEKAAGVKSGYLPDLDGVLESKKGICFDYAALMTAMLRCRQIPCKLVVGYAGTTYHAWISVWTREHGWIDGFIFFDGQVWTRMDPTFASSAKGSEDVLRFIQDGNYTTKYLY